MRKIWRKAMIYLLVTIMCFNVVIVPAYAQGNGVSDAVTEIVSEDVFESETYRVPLR